jgi:hypothetical protein
MSTYGNQKYNKFTTVRPLGRIMWHLRVTSMYHNGDLLGFVWNWWNPLALVMAAIIVPLFAIVFILIEGASRIDKKVWADAGLYVDPYFKKNPDKLKWVSHKEYKESFK